MTFPSCLVTWKNTAQAHGERHSLSHDAVIHVYDEAGNEVKNEYGHDLVKSYEALPSERRTLSPADTDLLAQINKLYVCKAFEYVQPVDAANGFSSFPDLEQLARLATNFASE